MTDLDVGSLIGHYPCIADEVDGKRSCGSSDALAVYEHDSEDGDVYYDGYCYSCNQAFNTEQVHTSSVGGELGVEGGVVTERKHFERKQKSQPLSVDETKAFINATGYKSNNYRGIKAEYSQFFGHLTKLSRSGDVLARYYPETQKNKVTGYKCRNHPKDFRYGKVGLTGLCSELAGQVKFQNRENHRDILIVGGEEDLAAAYQMLRENQIRKGQTDYAPIAVVSPTTGESSAIKQVKAQYDFLNKFENIVIGLDNDEVGREAANAIAEILPREKVKIAYWTGKDPNAMLVAGNEKQFLSDFYNAKSVVASSIKSSNDLDTAMFEELMMPKLPLPPFMSELEEMMVGGIPLGVIVNLGAASGVGKTSIINEILYYWIFNSPYRVGVISLELSAGQYGTAMLSRHIGKKLNLIRDPQEAIKFLNTPEIALKRQELWNDEYGEPRWYLLDERDGSLNQVKKQCELMIKKHGAQVIVCDPLQDILDGATNEEQSVFMRWQKKMVKEGVTFININHIRKSGSGDVAGSQGRDITEEDFQGSSSIFKSGAANVLFSRNKYAESPIEKNTTKVVASKIRWSGYTGNAGYWYYDLEAHTLHSARAYFKTHPDELPAGYDFDNPPSKQKNGKGSTASSQPLTNDKVTLADGVVL